MGTPDFATGVARESLRVLTLVRAARSGIGLLLEEALVLTSHLHGVDDQEASVDFDRYDFEHYATRVGPEKHDAIVLERRILRRRLSDDRVAGLDNVAAALMADSMLGR
jgi:hypothetical protein